MPAKAISVAQRNYRPATLLGLGYLWYTIRFARITRDPLAPASRLYARSLLRASILYLPLLLAAMMLDAKGRLLF